MKYPASIGLVLQKADRALTTGHWPSFSTLEAYGKPIRPTPASKYGVCEVAIRNQRQGQQWLCLGNSEGETMLFG